MASPNPVNQDDLAQRTMPVQARSVRRVDMILNTAAELIAEVGVDAASTSEIARRADISLASLYRYFPNKTAVIKAVAERQLKRLEPIYEQFLEDFDLDRGLDDLIDQLYAFYRSEPGYAQIWSGMQAIPELSSLDMDDFLYHAGRIRSRAAQLLPNVDPGQIEVIVLMVSRTIGSLVRQAMIMDEAQARDMLDEAKTMLRLYIHTRFEQLSNAG